MNAYALFCHLWPASVYNTFRLYLINDRTPAKKAIEHTFVCLFLYVFCLVGRVAQSV